MTPGELFAAMFMLFAADMLLWFVTGRKAAMEEFGADCRDS
jgi:hypothetical protein